MTDKTIWQQLAAEFPKELERQYQGRGNRTFTYIEPRDVMDRLDAVLGPAGWQFESSAVSDHVVHGRLLVKAGDAWIIREDFGYPNNAADDAEWLKEAQSDALRRCAMGFGVARYLYRRDIPGGQQRAGTVAAPSRPAAASPPAAAAPVEPEWDGIATIAQQTFPDAVLDESKCPDHDKPYRHNSRGYYCATKVGDGWCQRTPSKAWQAAHELAPATGGAHR